MHGAASAVNGGPNFAVAADAGRDYGLNSLSYRLWGRPT